MHDALGLVPKSAQQMVVATIHTVFFQPNADNARATWRRVANGFRARWPRLVQLLDVAEDEVLTYLAFPQEHWRQIWAVARRCFSAESLGKLTTIDSPDPLPAPALLEEVA
jgi:transposase-like protein